MKVKFSLIFILLLSVITMITPYCFAKYVIEDSSNISVYIDKTPPIINIKSQKSDEDFSKTNLENVIKENSEITVTTRDNIKVDYNEYYYNSTKNDFNDIESKKFESGTKFNEDGFYKFVSVDTSGNRTEIIVLLDKTPPEVKVEFYKKNAVVKTSVAATKRFLLSSSVIENTVENVVENEIENKVTNENITNNEIEIQNQVVAGNTITENKTIENQNVTNSINENTIVNNIVSENIIQNNGNIEKENTNTTNATNTVQNAVVQETITQESKSMLKSAKAGSITVYNETDLRNAINNKYSNIVIATSINCTSSLYINYAVTIRPGSNENAIRYNGYGSFIYVQSGGNLNLSSIVIDTRGMSNGRGINSINVQSGGTLVFDENSIVDGGTSNTGILINSGGKAIMYSCHIANCTKGIVVKGTGNLSFGNLNNGRNSEFWSNTTSISFESFSGTCNFNQANIILKDSTNGIVVESSTGKINISAGKYYNNSSNGIASKSGTMSVSGGSIYSNGNGINFGSGNLNISGSSIYSNKTGILINSSYSGKMTMSGGSIYSNTNYAINHGQNTDGACTILGGSISGKVYLAQNDNYVNTNDKYPTFTVTPSSYYFNRKLVKTNSVDYANNEISKITMTPSGSWYKYVNNNEYIVVWKGCNVIVNCVDYSGKVIKTETINGNLGDEYSITEKEIEGYDLIEIPNNTNGVFTEKDIVVEYKYDLKNIAKVTFEDLLSGISTAKYWYNSTEENFIEDGIDFENNKIFEEYGFYKIEVINNVGLKRELTFSLNKDSVKR